MRDDIGKRRKAMRFRVCTMPCPACMLLSQVSVCYPHYAYLLALVVSAQCVQCQNKVTQCPGQRWKTECVPLNCGQYLVYSLTLAISTPCASLHWRSVFSTTLYVGGNQLVPPPHRYSRHPLKLLASGQCVHLHWCSGHHWASDTGNAGHSTQYPTPSWTVCFSFPGLDRSPPPSCILTATYFTVSAALQRQQSELAHIQKKYCPAAAQQKTACGPAFEKHQSIAKISELFLQNTDVDNTNLICRYQHCISQNMLYEDTLRAISYLLLYQF